MSDANKALARRVFEEMWNRHDLSVVGELFAEDYRAHVASAPEAIDGIERLRRLMAMFQVVLPDLQFTVEDQIAEGDKVVTGWSARGTASDAAKRHLPEDIDRLRHPGVSSAGDLPCSTAVNIFHDASGGWRRKRVSHLSYA